MRPPTRIRHLEKFLEVTEEAVPKDSQKLINARRQPLNYTDIRKLEDFLDMNFLDRKPEDMLPPTERFDLLEGALRD